MSEPIGVGDTVMVVKSQLCCGHYGDMGRVFNVAAVHEVRWTCAGCGQPICCTAALPVADINAGYDIHRLKRIPPLVELSTNEIAETV